MQFEDLTFPLKDGRSAVLRLPRGEDADAVLEYLFVSSGETEFILRYPEECSKYTREGEKALFEARNASPDDAMLLCEVDGKVAGLCNLAIQTGLKTRHRGEVAIANLREFWNLGIGTKMFETLISLARARGGVRQLELTYIEGNDRARALYEKMGFVPTGEIPDAVRLKDGTFRKEIMMRKLLY